MKSIPIQALLLFSLFLLVAGAAADTIQVQNVKVTTIGVTTPVAITLDKASAGVAGYDITISLSDPSVASITEVTFPAWALLNESSPLPASTVRLRMVDLEKEIVPGATSVSFGSITLKGIASGSTDVVITIKEITSDAGESLSPTLQNGKFSIESARTEPIIADHSKTQLSQVPLTAITNAKSNLHIAYWHTSHGSQITEGMSGLVDFPNAPHGGSNYVYNDGGSDGALDLYDSYSTDLGNTEWPTITRNYLNSHTDVNVIMWSWCGQADSSKESIDWYLENMRQLERDYPQVTFVYMTGHLVGSGESGNLNLRNEQIRNYVRANNSVLFDFADIESYDPDGTYYGNRYATDGCNYDFNNNGVTTQSGDPALPTNGDRNWAIDWQNSHTEGTDWYSCGHAHTQPLNANRKAYAAWWLWARLGGWDGVPNNGDVVNAEVISASIPPTMVAGQSYTATVTMKNTGTKTWSETDTIRLGAVGDPNGFSAGRIFLPAGTSVAPNDQYTFTIAMKAPSTAGTYTPTYRMVWDGHQWFGAQASQSVTVTGGTVNAEMVSASIPPTMVAGQSYTATVRVKNTGTKTWSETDTIRLGAVGDPNGFSAGRIFLPAGTSVAPNAEYTFTIPMKAPATAGTYTPTYRMVWDGHQWFGAQASQSVTVTGGTVNAEMVSVSIPPTMIAGQSYTATVTMKNIGTKTWSETDTIRLGAVGDPNGFSAGRIFLPAGTSVAPNAEYTFTIPMKAPATAGTYTPTYRMVWDGHQWFGAQASQSVTVTGGTVNSEMVSASIPPTMVAGQSYTATVRLKNIGTKTWSETDTIRLGAVGDPNGFSAGRIFLPAGTSVAPNAEYTFTIPMKAPATAGTYTPTYRMVWDSHQWFGAQASQSVTVTGGTVNAEMVSASIPPTMVAGQSYTATVRVKNTGTKTWSETDTIRLGAVGDPNGFSAGRIFLPAGTSVAPNAEYTFTIPMKAPATAGTYTPTYRMVWDSHQWFGGTASQSVIVK